MILTAVNSANNGAVKLLSHHCTFQYLSLQAMNQHSAIITFMWNGTSVCILVHKVRCIVNTTLYNWIIFLYECTQNNYSLPCVYFLFHVCKIRLPAALQRYKGHVQPSGHIFLIIGFVCVCVCVCVHTHIHIL
jgi:hypothetical protein